MSKQGEEAKQKARAAKDARDSGKSASEAGVSTGASKQIAHAKHGKRDEANAELHREHGKT